MVADCTYRFFVETFSASTRKLFPFCSLMLMRLYIGLPIMNSPLAGLTG